MYLIIYRQTVYRQESRKEAQKFKPSENELWGFPSYVEGIWAKPGSAELLRFDMTSI
jgi:hypothetical protein